MMAKCHWNVTYSHGLVPGWEYRGAQLTDDDFARTGLAPSGGHVSVGRGEVRSGTRTLKTLLIAVEHHAFRVTSRVHLLNGRNGLIIYDEVLDLHDRFRRQGFARIALAIQVRTAILAGVTAIRAQVAGGDDDRFIGHVVWPNLGFDGYIPVKVWEGIPAGVRHASGMEGRADKLLGDFLASCPQAGQAWAEHGRGFDMTMQLDATAPAIGRHLNLLRRARL